MILRRFAATALFATVCPACDAITDVGKPLTVELTASKTSAQVGETLAFTVDATGRNLVLLVLDYGDGTADSTSAFGAQTAGADYVHSFAEPGAFLLEARALEAGGEFVDDDVTILVQAALAAVH